MTRIAVSGHRGLPAEVEAVIRSAIDVELSLHVSREDNLVGLSCLADGADQIFATAVIDHGGTLEAIIPADKYRDGLPEDARPLYDRLFQRASAVHRCDHRESTSQAHMDASVLMIDNADRLFAVWDGKPARSYGGTADVVAYAESKGVPVDVIWPAGSRRD